MAEDKAIKAGDPCPIDGGTFVIDARQDARTLIDRKRRNAANPQAAQRFGDALTEKTAEHGALHRCASCGYQTRFHTKRKAA